MKAQDQTKYKLFLEFRSVQFIKIKTIFRFDIKAKIS